jgi:outer membrane protein
MLSFKNLALPAVMGAALLVTGEASAQTKVAVIDMQKAINETNEGARANDTLKKLFDKRQVELNGIQENLLKEKTQLEKRCRATPSQAQCQSGMEELQKKLMELQNLMMQYQQDIQKKQTEATQPILTKMLTIIGRLAQQNSYDLVVDRAAVHFTVPAGDITDQAIKIYNSESNVAPLPPEAPKGDANKGKKPAKK